jgi:hypothetical protein
LFFRFFVFSFFRFFVFLIRYYFSRNSHNSHILDRFQTEKSIYSNAQSYGSIIQLAVPKQKDAKKGVLSGRSIYLS